MESKYFYYFLLGCGGLLFIGIMAMFVGFGSSNYYQEQNYNHLQSLDKPEAIQHYEQKVEEFNKHTESNASVNQTSVSSESTPMPTGTGQNIYPIIKDGYPQIKYMIILTLIWFVFYWSNPLSSIGIRTRNNVWLSFFVAYTITTLLGDFI